MRFPYSRRWSCRSCFHEMKSVPFISTMSTYVYPSAPSYGVDATVKRACGEMSTSASAANYEYAWMALPAHSVSLKITPFALLVNCFVTATSRLALENAPHWIGRPTVYFSTTVALSG